MNIHYWVLRLKVLTLVNILAKARKGGIERLTYLNSGKAVEYMIGLFRKAKRLNFALHKIEPRPGAAGPVLHLSDVRNDNGEVITMEIFRHICEIRKKISEGLMSLHEGTIASLGLTSTDMVHAWLGLKIADGINPVVYLAHYGRWKYFDSAKPKRNSNILVMPESSWSEVLLESIRSKNLMDRIVIEKDFSGDLKSLLLAGKYFMQSLISSVGRGRNGRRTSLDDRGKDKLKIMINYTLGIDKEARNDIPHIHAIDFNMSRLVFYFRYRNYLPSRSEIQWFEENGISFFSDPKISCDIPGVAKWQGTEILKRRAVHFSRKYSKACFRLLYSRKKHSRELLIKLWKMGTKMVFWQDFFLSNGVGIVIHSTPSANNFIVNLALSEIGGISVDVETSITFDSGTYLNNSPCHIRFVSGPYSISQMEEPSFSRHTLQCGALNVIPGREHPKEKRPLRKKWRAVLAVLDEVPSDVFFGDAVKEMYEAIFDLVSEDSDFFLIIKTKKMRVFEKIQEVKDKLDHLASEGKCVMLDWKKRVTEAFALSDLTVTLPSTAAFESVASGVPTAVYNPMRSGSSIFYTNGGLDRRIFEDAETMITAIKKFAYQEDRKIGDCRDIRPKIDPFQDGLASQRVGEYLIKCLEGFDLGMSRDDILNNANEDYAMKWGKENVIGS